MTVQMIIPQVGAVDELAGEALSEIARVYDDAMEALAQLALRADLRDRELPDGEPVTVTEEATS